MLILLKNKYTYIIFIFYQHIKQMNTHWHTCVVDDEYEINDEYPYNIRKIGKDKLISEYNTSDGYIGCKLNAKSYKKHRIVALQFIPNDDPIHKTDIDHLNNDRTDYHIENLRWCTRSQNNKNRGSMNNTNYTFIDELPETATQLSSYGKHDLDGIYIDNENEKVYVFNGIRYRELLPCAHTGNIFYTAYDIEEKKIKLYHKVLFG